VGHYARNCPTKNRRRVNLIDFNPETEDEVELEHFPPGQSTSANRIAFLKTELNAMSFGDKQQLAHELADSATEDFPTA
jgi:hypothetical protein